MIRIRETLRLNLMRSEHFNALINRDRDCWCSEKNFNECGNNVSDCEFARVNIKDDRKKFTEDYLKIINKKVCDVEKISFFINCCIEIEDYNKGFLGVLFIDLPESAKKAILNSLHKIVTGYKKELEDIFTGSENEED